MATVSYSSMHPSPKTQPKIALSGRTSSNFLCHVFQCPWSRKCGRFPFTAYENGGGAFLIPYPIVLFVIGRPLYYLEMALGQFTSRSSVKIWEVSPLFKGIGIGQLVGTTSVVSYYVSLIALTLHYIFASFASELPWATCKDNWADNCVDSSLVVNEMRDSNSTSGQKVSSSQIYFLDIVLKEKDSIDDGIGAPDWKLTLWLLLAWVVIFLVLVRGVKSSGKVAYFLAIFPYVVLIIILVRALTLEGAVDGVIFFIKPQWGELLNPKVWYSATTQLFFSLSVGMGSIIMFSSYNNFHHNIYRDAMIVTTLDTFTSLLGGMTIFSILGNLAHNLGIEDISKVVKSGTGLAFISYPDAIAKFDIVPQLFSVLFFFMLFVLGVGSAVALHGAIITAFWDAFPKRKYWHLALILSTIGFCTGLVYIHLVANGYSIWSITTEAFSDLRLAIIEMVAIFWIYGLDNWCNDIEFMVQRRVGLYVAAMLGSNNATFHDCRFHLFLVEYKWPTYSGQQYPGEALICGIFVFIFGILQVLIWAVWTVTGDSTKESVWGKISKAAKPSSQWGPCTEHTRKAWLKYKEEAKSRRDDIIYAKNHSSIVRKLCVLFGMYDDFIQLDSTRL
uniref:Sodium-dependent nutrient amino acid transporter 1 n=1 Tax=Aedes aegypti TaxID=7159 RepID=Q8T7E1_AEDAE|nr:amino acid transporter [Aedes aegypti]